MMMMMDIEENVLINSIPRYKPLDLITNMNQYDKVD
jgi:hypothetical protein